MPAEDHEYLDASERRDVPKIRSIFEADALDLLDDHKNARQQSIPVKPSYDAFAEAVMQKLNAKIPAIKSPLATSRIFEKLFTADGDRYFHIPETEKWSNENIGFQPESQQVEVIALPGRFRFQNGSKII